MDGNITNRRWPLAIVTAAWRRGGGGTLTPLYVYPGRVIFSRFTAATKLIRARLIGYIRRKCAVYARVSMKLLVHQSGHARGGYAGRAITPPVKAPTPATPMEVVADRREFFFTSSRLCWRRLLSGCKENIPEKTVRKIATSF